MHKLLTGVAAAAAFTLFASAALADCPAHSVTASTAPEETVTMSTYDGAAPQPIAEETEKPAEAVEVCAEREKDCAATK